MCLKRELPFDAIFFCLKSTHMDNFDELDRKGFLGLYRQMSGYIRVETELRNDEEERNFITMFGTSPDMCSYLWLLLQTQSFLLSAKARPVHLLWGLVMLKTYGSETLLLHSVRIDGMKATNRKTYRQWTWHIIHAIADLTAYVVSTYMHMCLQFTLLSPFFYFRNSQLLMCQRWGFIPRSVSFSIPFWKTFLTNDSSLAVHFPFRTMVFLFCFGGILQIMNTFGVLPWTWTWTSAPRWWTLLKENFVYKYGKERTSPPQLWT